ncbi:hypothetical protein Nepgr_013106 [Nepenthes gracilis]|uniref:DRBM domain-containing protein n=1 Tax=Nepenthes gracilis TaxID=150966 RepID=A0AAD3XP28_NEPGR|nr:hypothetical protein Nepgr_013106 [Nepenthes gracilis]
MYKNQLQELAQRSCFNLPSYTCIREGPDHAPRFKAIVNFNGERFESPSFCTTLRQAEHAAAEVALNSLPNRGPSLSLAARILDETGVYKNLLQEVSQRVGASLPLYTTFRSGLGHLPVFTCTVELAGISFTGVPAKNKKQAEKNAAMVAWLTLKQLTQESFGSSSVTVNSDEQEHVTVARALQNYLTKAKTANSSFPVKFPVQGLRPSNVQPRPIASSKILPLINPMTTMQIRHGHTAANKHSLVSQSAASEIPHARHMKFPAAEAAPYIPIRHLRECRGTAPPVTVRSVIPVYAAPASAPPAFHSPEIVRQAVLVCAAPPLRPDKVPVSKSRVTALTSQSAPAAEVDMPESVVIQNLKELKL